MSERTSGDPAAHRCPDEEEEQPPLYLGVLANERAYFARQLAALGLLATSVAAVELLSTKTISYVLASAAGTLSSSALIRWRRKDRDLRHV
ncbi:hypothetical protein [Mycolicibacterium iranicum]|uniref:Uncharacterized protein n=1 Tax=Mycolicibacterium iranicum TaxID=912594 RepID=A0A178LRW2_MYCIR|nr:hypothetical protein [Mycolicibacterium iranicum]OAN36137.1 hypothetical protein A4X20_25220 [Mycolicibacterium iranicum]